MYYIFHVLQFLFQAVLEIPWDKQFHLCVCTTSRRPFAALWPMRSAPEALEGDLEVFVEVLPAKEAPEGPRTPWGFSADDDGDMLDVPSQKSWNLVCLLK